MIKPILLYAVPISSNTCKTSINKIATIENKTLRMISCQDSFTSNEKIRQQLEINEKRQDIYEHPKLFYTQRTKHLSTLSNVGLYNENNAPFRIKYKLPHSLLLQDCNNNCK